VKTPHKSYRVYLARGKRDSWGRKDRERVIVFGEVGNSFYPWTEFVETDTEHFAAPIPNPEHPRKMLTPSDPMPGRYRGYLRCTAANLLANSGDWMECT
jgi:hypothetical protein